MTDPRFHAHIYYDAATRADAAALRDRIAGMTKETGRSPALFTGRMTDAPIGPHPIPQFEIHFLESSLPALLPVIEASGLSALIHPLTDDDLADHSTLARWVGEALVLDLTALDPPGVNQGVARFGKTDF